MPFDVLFVDLHADRIAESFTRVLEGIADVEPCADFHGARTRLLSSPPDALVTNLRLGPYNGLHLVLLATPAIRSLVYGEPEDLLLAREAQRLGAFYEREFRLAFALPAFLKATLPERDRRAVGVLDRRFSYRGGRRRIDLAPAHPAS